MAKSLPVIDRNLAFEKSVELLRKCTSPHGFLASSENIDNYHRVFARDSMILSMAALMLDTDEFVETIKSSLRTLKKYSGKHGEIPSNVDGDSGSVSFGGNVGRVDSNMWFIVGAGEYILRYDDKAFFEEMREMIEKILFFVRSMGI
jgi:glycogen debranching enzyme